ncbi:ATP-binding protein [Methanoculleus chikugoensis]|uniref:sensor histidine kinase n=1 Tax=Methanoculleus chikugoensis TaxID=118126 RepID=UPI001FB3C178|nr:ATP-binding protein [Methanoculleus chikugoensis]
MEGQAAGYAANLKRSITKSIEILGIVSKIRQIHAGPPTLRPTDLDAVIRTEIDHFPAVPISYEGASCKVVADGLLCEVFTNLIGNAVKHGGPGVAVTVRVEEQNGEVLVTVADTGRGGVPDDQKEEIFHRYERKQRGGVGEGGLGLYLVQILIDRYGGGGSGSKTGCRGGIRKRERHSPSCSGRQMPSVLPAVERSRLRLVLRSGGTSPGWRRRWGGQGGKSCVRGRIRRDPARSRTLSRTRNEMSRSMPVLPGFPDHRRSPLYPWSPAVVQAISFCTASPPSATNP